MADLERFPPTSAAALARLDAVDLDDYARTRNALTGAVSRLSPYITHGFLTLPDIVQNLAGKHPLDLKHKFVYELGWREYSRHVWRIHGDGILGSLHPGPLPDSEYGSGLPDDVRTARTGIPVIDRAVRTLYEVGYLHNHARMWLASYLVHVRKVSWRTGADWMIAHLLDGDLASNHLGWQWVAGTASSKPYLFNADNVARFAPAAWHSPHTVIDTSYEALDALARTRPTPPPVPSIAPQGTSGPTDTPEPPTHAAPPSTARIGHPDATVVAGRDVWLMHPWALRAPPADRPPGTLLVGVFIAGFHERWPWSLTRWQFVCTRMRELTPHCWYGDAAAIAHALRAARTVSAVADPHWSLGELATLSTVAAPRLFAEIDQPCASFSQWWTAVQAAGSSPRTSSDLPPNPLRCDAHRSR
jgi:deoxyribodipyrimidine photo-lyase